MSDIYQQEKDALLNFMINERFFKYWRKEGVPNLHQAGLEIFITPECNQKCEYCYLHKRREELYPSELLNRKKLIENFHILLNYLLKNKFYITEIELFTGEIWHTDFGVEILTIMLEYIKKGLKVNSVIIPTNAFFVSKNETLEPIQKLINEYNKLNKGLLFSLSIDGKIIEDLSRPLNSNESRVNDFYDRLFSFAARNRFFVHPMVSAQNVKYWIDNHKWFCAELEKYDSIEAFDFMTLEVRNDDWTEESIEDYKKYIKYLIDLFYKKCFNSDIKEFSKYLYGEQPLIFQHQAYIPFRISERRTKACGCSIPNTLTVRLGDLMITPCHRLSTPEFNYGQFVVENGEIIGITAKNTYMANRVLFTNNDAAHPKCDTCVIRDICVKGCFGSQYEHSGDPFIPIECVCELQKAKILTALEYFEEIGVIKEWEKCDIENLYYPNIDKILTVYKNLKKESKINHENT